MAKSQFDGEDIDRVAHALRRRVWISSSSRPPWGRENDEIKVHHREMAQVALTAYHASKK